MFKKMYANCKKALGERKKKTNKGGVAYMHS